MDRITMKCERCDYEATYEKSYVFRDEPPECPCCHGTMKEIIHINTSPPTLIEYQLSSEQKKIKENIKSSIRYHGVEMVFRELDLIGNPKMRCAHRKLFLMAVKELNIPFRLEGGI